MKRIYTLYIMLSITALTIMSCKESDEILPTLMVSQQTDIVFSAEATESKVIIVAANSPTWNAQSDQTWCLVTLNPNQNSFTVTALPNTSETPSADATITVTSTGAAPIKIKVVQTPYVQPVSITMPHAEFTHWGNISGLTSDIFYLYLYKGVDELDPEFQALQITGMTDLQRPEKFKLPPGEYTLYKAGVNPTRAFFAGAIKNHYGTILYTWPNKEEFSISHLVIDGKVIVEVNDGIYTINVDLVAIDAITQRPVPNIKMNYTGTLDIKYGPGEVEVGPYKDGDIPAATYVASGEPLGKSAFVAPTTWSGTITPFDIPDTAYPGETVYKYKISNFADLGRDVNLKLNNGFLIVDKTALTPSVNGITEAFSPSGYDKAGSSTIYSVTGAIIQYENGIIDFSLENDEIFVGVGIQKFSYGQFFDLPANYVSDVYRNLKLTLTPIAGASAFPTLENQKQDAWTQFKRFKAKQNGDKSATNGLGRLIFL